MRLKIRHNAEIAHRLSKTGGKCQQIHGHGLQIELVFIDLMYDETTAMLVNNEHNVFEFGALKKKFREYIDTTYDHHLLLNKNDDFAKELVFTDPSGIDWKTTLPGLVTVEDDPTVENLAKWIAEWAAKTWHTGVVCRIEETKTNGAEAYVTWNGFGTQVRT